MFRTGPNSLTDRGALALRRECPLEKPLDWLVVKVGEDGRPASGDRIHCGGSQRARQNYNQFLVRSTVLLPVDWTPNGIEGLDKARAGGAAAMIIDRMLPGMDEYLSLLCVQVSDRVSGVEAIARSREGRTTRLGAQTIGLVPTAGIAAVAAGAPS
jgi:hypothetical protein